MILVWFGAVLIGLSLGLLGSGGSILTVPVLVYLAGEDPKVAVAESLAIVGIIALFGALPYARKGCVQWRSVLLFGAPGIAGTVAGSLLGHVLPAALQLLIFAGVMLVAAVRMFRPMTACLPGAVRPVWQVALAGLGVGVLTGVVGVGGGFLILPALVLLLGLPMSQAVGTSLVIIALNAAFGFAAHLPQFGNRLHWSVIGLMGVIGVLGSFLGESVSRFLSPLTLRRSFAAFLVVLGVYILASNLPHAVNQWQQARIPDTVRAVKYP